MDSVKDKVETHPEVREKLNTKAAGVSGAKASLLKQLKKLEAEENDLHSKSTSRPSQPTPKASTGVTTEISKKAAKRDQELTPEKLEESEKDKDWVEIQD